MTPLFQGGSWHIFWIRPYVDAGHGLGVALLDTAWQVWDGFSCYPLARQACGGARPQQSRRKCLSCWRGKHLVDTRKVTLLGLGTEIATSGMGSQPPPRLQKPAIWRGLQAEEGKEDPLLEWLGSVLLSVEPEQV